jgi:hypothetical protein
MKAFPQEEKGRIIRHERPFYLRFYAKFVVYGFLQMLLHQQVLYRISTQRAATNIGKEGIILASRGIPKPAT